MFELVELHITKKFFLYTYGSLISSLIKLVYLVIHVRFLVQIGKALVFPWRRWMMNSTKGTDRSPFNGGRHTTDVANVAWLLPRRLPHVTTRRQLIAARDHHPRRTSLVAN